MTFFFNWIKSIHSIFSTQRITMGLILYYKSESPPVRSVKLCIKALDLSVQFKDISNFPKDNLDLNSNKICYYSIPVLQDGNFILWDSHAINSYLVTVYGQDDTLYPKDPKVRAIVDQRMYFECGNLYTALKQIALDIFSKKSPEVSPECRHKVCQTYGILESYLDEQRYIACDHITIADFSIIASLSTLEIIIPELDNYLRLCNYLDTCKKIMPGYDSENALGVENFKALLEDTLEKNQIPLTA